MDVRTGSRKALTSLLSHIRHLTASPAEPASIRPALAELAALLDDRYARERGYDSLADRPEPESRRAALHDQHDAIHRSLQHLLESRSMPWPPWRDQVRDLLARIEQHERDEDRTLLDATLYDQPALD